MTLLFLCIGPSPREAAAAPISFRELQVDGAVLGPGGVAGTECEDCADECPLLFAFPGPADALFVFDGAQNVLTEYSLSSDRATRARTIPSFRLDADNELPHDGCYALDGSIHLVVDRGSVTDRFRVWSLPRDSSAWEPPTTFDDPEIGTHRIRGSQVQVYRSIRIDGSDDGRVLIYDADLRTPRIRWLGDGVPARGGQRTAALRAATLSEPKVSTGPLRLQQRWELERSRHGARGSGVRGRVVAFVGDGAALSVESSGKGRRSLSLYSRNDALIGKSAMPELRGSSKVSGKGEFLTLADGRVVQVAVTGGRLRLFVWTGELP